MLDAATAVAIGGGLSEPLIALLLGGGVVCLLLGSPEDALVTAFRRRNAAVTGAAGPATLHLLEFLKPQWRKRLMT